MFIFDNNNVCVETFIRKRVASIKLSLFLKNYLQDIQTLQLNWIGNYFQM